MQSRLLQHCNEEVQLEKDFADQEKLDDDMSENSTYPLIEGVIFLASKLAQFESKVAKSTEEPPAVEVAQR